VARLVGTDGERILEVSGELLEALVLEKEGTQPLNPYGDGRAGERIADIVVAHLTGIPRLTSDWGGV
jgi:UDP-N-acetylglucosamine 2-epimerase